MDGADACETSIRRFLADEVFLHRRPESIGLDDDLVAMGLDSLAVLRLVLFIETQFGIDANGEDVLAAERLTVRGVAAYCAERRLRR